MEYLRLLRPQQWIKNVFIFAGVIFARKLADPEALLAVVLGFCCMCLASSAVYVFNDVKDREEDQHHPRKSKRPLASGAISVPHAVLVGLAVGLIGLLGSLALNRGFFLVVACYLVLQALYTLRLKQAALLDVLIIAIGFVLRAVGGAVLAHVDISIWLVLCTFTLCMFMGFSKRRCELEALSENGGTDAHLHRPTLARYTPALLNHMITVSAGIAIISFMLYATDPVTTKKFGTQYLAYTLPLVVYAVFRFALLVEHGQVDGPTDVVLRDRPFQYALVLWAVAAIVIVYRGPQIQAWLQEWVAAGTA